MNDNAIHQHIETLVQEEEALYAQSGGRHLSQDERKRLDELSVQLDRYYDLLRQRRAKREFGENPDRAHMRSGETVENYVE